MKSSILVKVLSTALVLCFAVEQASYAAIDWKAGVLPASPLLATPIPGSLGNVEEVYHAPGSGRSLILIQDAHTNDSCQQSVSRILDLLARREGVRLVFLEAGTGDDSLSDLRTRAPQAARERVARAYMARGLLKGAEHLDLTSEHDLLLWGVEDKALYWESFDLYKQIAAGRGRFLAYLDRIDGTARSLKGRLYNPALLRFDRRREAYLGGELSTTEYFEILAVEAERAGWPSAYYPHIAAMKKLKGSELAIDFARAQAEQAKAVASLAPADLPELAAAANAAPSRLTAEDRHSKKAFYALLGEKADLSGYPELSKYIAYLGEASSVDPDRVLREERALETRVYDALTRTEDERRLRLVSEAARSLRKLIDLRLTPEEFSAYRGNPASADIAFLTGFLNRKILERRDGHADALFLEEGWGEFVDRAERFYGITYRRDADFMRRALEKMQAEGQTKAALVAGGYHGPNLKALCRANGVSYISLLPQVLKETNHERYEKILLALESERPAAGGSDKKDILPLREQRVLLRAFTADLDRARLASAAPESLQTGARLSAPRTFGLFDRLERRLAPAGALLASAAIVHIADTNKLPAQVIHEIPQAVQAVSDASDQSEYDQTGRLVAYTTANADNTRDVRVTFEYGTGGQAQSIVGYTASLRDLTVPGTPPIASQSFTKVYVDVTASHTAESAVRVRFAGDRAIVEVTNEYLQAQAFTTNERIVTTRVLDARDGRALASVDEARTWERSIVTEGGTLVLVDARVPINARGHGGGVSRLIVIDLSDGSRPTDREIPLEDVRGLRAVSPLGEGFRLSYEKFGWSRFVRSEQDHDRAGRLLVQRILDNDGPIVAGEAFFAGDITLFRTGDRVTVTDVERAHWDPARPPVYRTSITIDLNDPSTIQFARTTVSTGAVERLTFNRATEPGGWFSAAAEALGDAEGALAAFPEPVRALARDRIAGALATALDRRYSVGTPAQDPTDVARITTYRYGNVVRVGLRFDNGNFLHYTLNGDSGTVAVSTNGAAFTYSRAHEPQAFFGTLEAINVRLTQQLDSEIRGGARRRIADAKAFVLAQIDGNFDTGFFVFDQASQRAARTDAQLIVSRGRSSSSEVYRIDRATGVITLEAGYGGTHVIDTRAPEYNNHIDKMIFLAGRQSLHFRSQGDIRSATLIDSLIAGIESFRSASGNFRINYETDAVPPIPSYASGLSQIEQSDTHLLLRDSAGRRQFRFDRGPGHLLTYRSGPLTPDHEETFRRGTDGYNAKLDEAIAFAREGYTYFRGLGDTARARQIRSVIGQLQSYRRPAFTDIHATLGEFRVRISQGLFDADSIIVEKTKGQSSSGGHVPFREQTTFIPATKQILYSKTETGSAAVNETLQPGTDRWNRALDATLNDLRLVLAKTEGTERIQVSAIIDQLERARQFEIRDQRVVIRKGTFSETVRREETFLRDGVPVSIVTDYGRDAQQNRTETVTTRVNGLLENTATKTFIGGQGIYRQPVRIVIRTEFSDGTRRVATTEFTYHPTFGSGRGVPAPLRPDREVTTVRDGKDTVIETSTKIYRYDARFRPSGYVQTTQAGPVTTVAEAVHAFDARNERIVRTTLTTTRTAPEGTTVTVDVTDFTVSAQGRLEKTVESRREQGEGAPTLRRETFYGQVNGRDEIVRIKDYDHGTLVQDRTVAYVVTSTLSEQTIDRRVTVDTQGRVLSIERVFPAGSQDAERTTFSYRPDGTVVRTDLYKSVSPYVGTSTQTVVTTQRFRNGRLVLEHIRTTGTGFLSTTVEETKTYRYDANGSLSGTASRRVIEGVLSRDSDGDGVIEGDEGPRARFVRDSESTVTRRDAQGRPLEIRETGTYYATTPDGSRVLERFTVSRGAERFAYAGDRATKEEWFFVESASDASRLPSFESILAGHPHVVTESVRVGNQDIPVRITRFEKGTDVPVSRLEVDLDVRTVSVKPDKPGVPGTPEAPGTPGTPDGPGKTPPQDDDIFHAALASIDARSIAVDRIAAGAPILDLLRVRPYSALVPQGQQIPPFDRGAFEPPRGGGSGYTAEDLYLRILGAAAPDRAALIDRLAASGVQFRVSRTPEGSLLLEADLDGRVIATVEIEEGTGRILRIDGKPAPRNRGDLDRALRGQLERILRAAGILPKADSDEAAPPFFGDAELEELLGVLVDTPELGLEIASAREDFFAALDLGPRVPGDEDEPAIQTDDALVLALLGAAAIRGRQKDDDIRRTGPADQDPDKGTKEERGGARLAVSSDTELRRILRDDEDAIKAFVLEVYRALPLEAGRSPLAILGRDDVPAVFRIEPRTGASGAVDRLDLVTQGQDEPVLSIGLAEIHALRRSRAKDLEGSAAALGGLLALARASALRAEIALASPVSQAPSGPVGVIVPLAALAAAKDNAEFHAQAEILLAQISHKRQNPVFRKHATFYLAGEEALPPARRALLRERVAKALAAFRAPEGGEPFIRVGEPPANFPGVLVRAYDPESPEAPDPDGRTLRLPVGGLGEGALYGWSELFDTALAAGAFYSNPRFFDARTRVIDFGAVNGTDLPDGLVSYYSSRAESPLSSASLLNRIFAGTASRDEILRHRFVLPVIRRVAVELILKTAEHMWKAIGAAA